MKMIKKYLLKMQPEQNIDMPEGMKIVQVMPDRDELAVLAYVDPEREMEPRTFMMFTTDQPIADDDAKYIEYVATAPLGGVMDMHLFIWEGLRK